MSKRIFAIAAGLALFLIATLAVALYQEPRLSLGLLAAGLRRHNPTLVHATLRPHAVLTGIAHDLGERAKAADPPKPGTPPAELAMRRMRAVLMQTAVGQLPALGESWLESYLTTPAASLSSATALPVVALLGLPPAKLAGLAAAEASAAPGEPTRDAARATIPLRITSPLFKEPVELTLLLERDGLLWQVVGVLNTPALLEALGA
jgi:hypothetical protein